MYWLIDQDHAVTAVRDDPPQEFFRVRDGNLEIGARPDGTAWKRVSVNLPWRGVAWRDRKTLVLVFGRHFRLKMRFETEDTFDFYRRQLTLLVWGNSNSRLQCDCWL